MNKDFPLNRFNFTNLIEHIRTEILIPNVITDDETGIEFYGGDSIPQKALIDLLKNFNIIDNQMCIRDSYNRLQRLSVKVQEGSAGIDVALEKRYDMLSEEIEAVKKYLAHEYQIYTCLLYTSESR